MKIVIYATVKRKDTETYEEVKCGYVNNQNINNFDYDREIKKFLHELSANKNYSYVRISNVVIGLGYTYPVFEEKTNQIRV